VTSPLLIFSESPVICGMHCPVGARHEASFDAGDDGEPGRRPQVVSRLREIAEVVQVE
jgi:hypothetical protein